MHVVTLLASPRPEGNTGRILDRTERALVDWKHTVERIHLNTMEIKDCAACLACAESADEPGCALHDDVPEVFERIMAADDVVFASPLYMRGITGPLKMLFDRTLCLVRGCGTPEHRSFVDGKRITQLITCAGGDGDNTEPVTTCFSRLGIFLRANHRGTFVLPNCTEPAHLPNTHGSKAQVLAERLTE